MGTTPQAHDDDFARDLKARANIPGLSFTSRKYGTNNLQRVGIWQRTNSVPAPNARWIIYIHGGAWRDYSVDYTAIIPTIQHLLPLSPAIRGFMSIDYRLSPITGSPQSPSTPANQLRNARHPDHILDVRSALDLLVRQYGLTNNYVLVGHSVGATMAYQVLEADYVLNGHSSPYVPNPVAVIGISGIYDLVGIEQRHGGIYTDFITEAEGSNKANWQKVSPLYYPYTFVRTDGSHRLSILAASRDDSLVDEPEIDNMAHRLTLDGVTLAVRKDLVGEHDYSWQDGTQVANLITQALSLLP